MKSKYMRKLTFLIAIVATCLNLSAYTEELQDSVLVISGEGDVLAYAYSDRKDIKEVRFEKASRIKRIDEYAFIGCENLQQIQLPESLTTLGEGCFRETGLRSLTLPKGVQVIPRAMCAWCEKLESAEWSDSLKDIGAQAFVYCVNLREVSFPPSLMHIGANAFSECKLLQEVVLPARMKELESYAFSECEQLRKATLPANDNLLGELIFSGCRNLKELVIESPHPPKFDCNSFIFEPDEIQLYHDCRLIIPSTSEGAYRHAQGWNLFF